MEGKKLFKEALHDGGMESYFPLSEQFVTQSEPALCSLSSLTMVLNALNFDPQKIWKGAWRWISEEMLKCESAELCGHSYEKIKKEGMNFSEFHSLAHCHGVTIDSYRILPTKDGSINSSSNYECNGLEQFRNFVKYVSSSSKAKQFIIVNFSRKYIEQTGDGHFSPIGGYHREKDLVLIMDTARFKYPPFWVPLTKLYEAMTIEDINTKKPRGYFVISTKS